MSMCLLDLSIWNAICVILEFLKKKCFEFVLYRNELFVFIMLKQRGTF